MVANRLSVKPLSKLAGCDWVAERAFVQGLAEVSMTSATARWTSARRAARAAGARVLLPSRACLILEVDLLFFDTSSTYWETDWAPQELQQPDEAEAEHLAGEDAASTAPLVERGRRASPEAQQGSPPPICPRSSSGWPSARGSRCVDVFEPALTSNHPQGQRRSAWLEPRPRDLSWIVASPAHATAATRNAAAGTTSSGKAARVAREASAARLPRPLPRRGGQPARQTGPHRRRHRS